MTEVIWFLAGFATCFGVMTAALGSLYPRDCDCEEDTP